MIQLEVKAITSADRSRAITIVRTWHPLEEEKWNPVNFETLREARLRVTMATLVEQAATEGYAIYGYDTKLTRGTW